MKNRAFTLIELLIVVLIIGVLTAIALPKYQTAVDKSRYATLMPMAKSLASAQESFEMANGYYSEDLSKLDVQFPGNSSGYSGTLMEDITATISDTADYDFVKMSKEGLNNNYILYLNKSGNYPNEIHCEALKNNNRAKRLCETLGGVKIKGSLTEGYDTYILEGTGNGLSYSIAVVMKGVQCSEDENSGTKSCNVTRDDNSVIKTVCTNKDNPSTCTYHIYDKEGYRWECLGSKGKFVNGVCLPTAKGAYAYRYDDEGNRKEMQCDSYDSTADHCKDWVVRTYNEDNTKISSDKRVCETWGSDGNCTSYKQNNGYNSFGTSAGYAFSSDIKPHQDLGSLDVSNKTLNWAQLNCAAVDNEGTCTSFKNGYFDTMIIDENKLNMHGERINCSKVTSDRQCETVSSYQTLDRTYNDNGKEESKIWRECLTRDTSGNCTNYSTNSNNNYQENYTYDSNNNQTLYTRYRCATVSNATECATYATSEQVSYTYNEQNRQKSEVRTGCDTYEGTTCTQLSSASTSTYKTYAENGTTQTSQTTIKCNQYKGLSCTGGWTVTIVPYVNGKADNNHKDINSNCSKVDMATGQCLDE
ncbi:MAG: prepilin-type N-terminal cleavage/methylation domain-containing protein [Elusimicrobiaceae bacterium]|nr:prepilin-type N-terminal cleavage/methylation domain-containing protein [Elusimicrobiaceae bacterium]